MSKIIRHDVVQGSEEWHLLRLGKISASRAKYLITGTGKPSTQYKTLALELASEIITGESEQVPETFDILRGNELEPVARKTFEFEAGVEVDEVGVFENKELDIICSPDGLFVTNDVKVSGLEIKCPRDKNHVRNVINEKLEHDYYSQIQFSMLASCVERWVFASYSEKLGLYWRMIEADESYQSVLIDQIGKCNKEIKRIVSLFSKKEEK